MLYLEYSALWFTGVKAQKMAYHGLRLPLSEANFVGGGEVAEAKALTCRELEIVLLLCEGNNSREVALALGRSVRTVDSHRISIMRKLKVRKIADLVRYAVRNLIIEP